MLKQMVVSFGDNVRILSGAATDAAGISGLSGCIYGETVPSASGVPVLGELSEDYAINVYVEDLNQDFWLDPTLVQFIDHGAGMEITIAGAASRFVRQPDGSWMDVPSARKAWWRFW